MNEKIEYPGVISRVEKGRAFVRIVQQTACSGCHVKNMCHISGIKEKIVEVPVRNHSFATGDQVLVVGYTSMGLKAVGYAFFLPLVLVVLSLFLFQSIFLQEALAGIATLVVVAIYYVLLYRFRNYFRKRFVFEIRHISDRQQKN